MAKLDLNKPLSKAVFGAFDTETTGFYPMHCRVVEYACVQFDLSKERGSYDTLLSIDRPMPPDASRVNGITDAMLKGQPSFKKVADKIGKSMEVDVAIAHNAMFDIGFINREFMLADAPIPQVAVIDSVQLARSAFPGLSSYGLGSLCGVLKIENPGAHRALADARALAQLVKHCIERLNLTEKTLGDLTACAGKAQNLGGWGLPFASGGVATTLKLAIEKGKKVVLEYQNDAGECAMYEVSPYAIENLAKGFKVIAADSTQRDQQFFLSRIKSARAELPPQAQGMLF